MTTIRKSGDLRKHSLRQRLRENSRLLKDISLALKGKGRFDNVMRDANVELRRRARAERKTLIVKYNAIRGGLYEQENA